jgi:hypothetical protein
MNSYIKWKSVTDHIYSGEITAEKGVDLLLDILAERNIKTRSKPNVLLGVSFWVYDKDEWKKKDGKPLGLGLVYKKYDNSKTQDIFICSPDDEIEAFYKETEMIKKYPRLKGAHKQNLPL